MVCSPSPHAATHRGKDSVSAAQMKEFFLTTPLCMLLSRTMTTTSQKAHVPQSDTHIGKRCFRINEEVEKPVTRQLSLVPRRDVNVVAFVSCIYGIGSPQDYAGLVLM